MPDESMDSILLRYHHLTASSSLKRSFEALFGPAEKSYVPAASLIHVTLRRNIRTLAQRIPGDPQKILEKLYRDHTFDPLTIGDRYARDLAHIPVSVSEFTKVCDRCMAEDSSQYGVMYWHRSHQIYEVTHCWKHGTKLTAEYQFNDSIRPGSFYSKKANIQSTLPQTDHRLKYARTVHFILNNSMNGVNKLKVIDYKIWKSKAIKTPNIAERTKQILPSLWKIRWRAPSHSTLVSGTLREISAFFSDPMEFLSYAKCGILNSSNEHPKIFQENNPGINWKWVYRYEALRSPRGSPEMEWLEKYDSRWSKRLETIKTEPMESSKRSYLLEKFKYESTYMYRL
nr:TniQ family protein [Pseudomonas sp. SO81]